MNRYFLPREGFEGYPRHSYAKLDDIEPPNIEEADKIRFAFDAIDTKWIWFETGWLWDLAPEGGPSRGFWKQQFGPPDDRGDDIGNPFDDLPMYRIEITLDLDHPWTQDLIASGEQWFEIELNDAEGIEAEVYGGLFMPPVPARLARRPHRSRHTARLEELFDMDDWPDATADQLDAALQTGGRVERLLMFDVGQGSAMALVSGRGHVMYYFDVGCGAYRNAGTRPGSVSFCTHDSAPHGPPAVILSHWDADHWAGATVDQDLLKLTWITPRQSITAKHKAFASAILAAGGTLLIVPSTLPSYSWNGAGQHFELRRCIGRDRNGSGLALVVEDEETQRGWLLTGDAGYQHIPGDLPNDLAAVAAPHHGADMGPASIPPSRPSIPYSRLIYSFGPNNAHGRTSVRHPTTAAVNAHIASGWPHGAWLPASPGTALAGTPVLATASHLTMHEGGISVGWTTPPSPLLEGHVAACSKIMPVSQS